MNFKDYFGYKKENLVTVIILFVIWYGISYLINLIPNNFFKLGLFMFILSLLLIFLVVFVNKFGILIMFYLIWSIFGIKIPSLEGFQLNFTLELIIIGLIFEILFVLLYFLIKNKIYSKILALAISNSIIFLLIGFFVSYNFIIANIEGVINLFLIFLPINMVGCIFGIFIWHSFRSSKLILKLEYSNT